MKNPKSSFVCKFSRDYDSAKQAMKVNEMENVITYTRGKLQQQNNKHYCGDAVSTSESH